MIIAIPTGIKIFSWLINSFSKSNMLIKKYIKIYNNYNNNNNIIINNNNPAITSNRGNKYYHNKLVIYGTNLSTNLKNKEYKNNNTIKDIINIPDNIIYIINGILLTNGLIEYKSKKLLINSRFKFKQTLKQVEYILYVYNKLNFYCVSPPKLIKSRLRGKIYYQVELKTISLSCFTKLRNLFYNGRVKIVPNNLYDLLNYESLAHIIICDGSYSKGGGMVLYLQSYTIKELIFIINILKIKFNLDCILQKHKSYYIIYIKVKSIRLLYPHIIKYIIPSIRYKFEYKLLQEYDKYM